VSNDIELVACFNLDKSWSRATSITSLCCISFGSRWSSIRLSRGYHGRIKRGLSSFGLRICSGTRVFNSTTRS
jgi:hypothetical protein